MNHLSPSLFPEVVSTEVYIPDGSRRIQLEFSGTRLEIDGETRYTLPKNESLTLAHFIIYETVKSPNELLEVDELADQANLSSLRDSYRNREVCRAGGILLNSLGFQPLLARVTLSRGGGQARADAPRSVLFANDLRISAAAPSTPHSELRPADDKPEGRLVPVAVKPSRTAKKVAGAALTAHVQLPKASKLRTGKKPSMKSAAKSEPRAPRPEPAPVPVRQHKVQEAKGGKPTGESVLQTWIAQVAENNEPFARQLRGLPLEDALVLKRIIESHPVSINVPAIHKSLLEYPEFENSTPLDIAELAAKVLGANIRWSGGETVVFKLFGSDQDDLLERGHFAWVRPPMTGHPSPGDYLVGGSQLNPNNLI